MDSSAPLSPWESEFASWQALKPEHPFSWQSIQQDPKSPNRCFSHRGDWYKTLEYRILHTGGFCRLCTDRGRVYWVAQNEHHHQTPDWKLHFSCAVSDVPRAWDIIACAFMQRHCEIGMKATYATVDESSTASPIEGNGSSSSSSTSSSASLPSSSPAAHDPSHSTSNKYAYEQHLSWPAKQRGREITVYIFSHDPAYGNGPMDDFADDDEKHIFRLGTEFEAGYDAAHWFRFIRDVERRLARAGVRSNGGVADGDLALPGCRYASLRNEAYVNVPRRLLAEEYPSSSAGANAAAASAATSAASSSSSTPTSTAASSSSSSSSLSSSSSTAAESTSSEAHAASRTGEEKSQEEKATAHAEMDKLELVYPPNSSGWNASKQFNPLDRTIVCLQVLADEVEFLLEMGHGQRR